MLRLKRICFIVIFIEKTHQQSKGIDDKIFDTQHKFQSNMSICMYKIYTGCVTEASYTSPTTYICMPSVSIYSYILLK